MAGDFIGHHLCYDTSISSASRIFILANLTRISKNSPNSIGGEMNCYLLHSAIVGM